ncbi:MAG: ATP-dependent RNA helicase HrpA [Deltaproteobacteria bacterium]|nr:ATP-dependent RNA helicase HrpA [Deltaproteobacteria bacterium]
MNQNAFPRNNPKLSQALERAMARDRWAVLGELSRKKGRAGQEAAARAQKRLAASAEKRLRRQENLPALSYPEDLPITAKREEIVSAIRENQVVVVTGETGSGKSTQIPKMCLEAGRGLSGVVGVTQPRRIAAVTIAQRIAQELSQPVGEAIGYRIRFQERGTRGRIPYVKLMTDGILLNEIQSDRLLSAYDAIMVDEAHERSLNIDFVLGVLRRLVKRRDDLSVIITSATLETEKFSKAFGNAPIIEVSGRTYPVSVRHEPLEEGGDPSEGGYVDAAVAAVEKIFARGGPAGDVLVFMPTENDILETCDLLRARDFFDTEVLPLYARLSGPEQARVFAPSGRRRIVVATNVAETSVTIPNIRYVVDTGLARISRYSPRTRTTSLPVSRVARSSADQRKGRAGRVAEGVCVRLYSEEDYLARPEFTPPEILRSNLAEVVLRMAASKLGDPAEFPFVDPPRKRNIADAVRELEELGAVAPARGRGKRKGVVLTKRGRTMARLPLDPRLARILIQAEAEACLPQALVVVSALSIADPRTRPAESEAEADRAHQAFADPRSDFLTLLNLWNAYHRLEARGASVSARRRFCRENFLSFGRMREWKDVYREVRTQLAEEGFSRAPAAGVLRAPDYAALHRAVLSGYLSNIALVKEKNIYQAARGREVMLFPGSSLFNRGGRYVVAAEMVQTTRLFARTAAVVEPAWIEDLAGDLVKKAYSRPRWDRDRGEVVADCRVSLFGVPLAEGRKVSYGPVAPGEAADIFIRQGLLEQDLPGRWPFLSHNRKVLARVEAMESRLRRRDLAVSEDRLAAWYAARLPGVNRTADLKKRIREQGSDDFLRMEPEDVLAKAPDAAELSLYPEKVSVSGEKVAVSYVFAPGDPADGATLRLPASLAGTVFPHGLERIIPGLLRDRVVALVKALPKAYRKALVPAAQSAQRLFEEVRKGSGPLAEDLSAAARRLFSADVPPAAWPLSSLPDHLNLRVALVDARGGEIAAGRDLPRVLGGLAAVAKAPPALLAKARRRWEKTGLTRWDFGDLPRNVALDDKGSARAFPALSPNGDKADLVLLEDAAEAARVHPRGVLALARNALKREIKPAARLFSLSGKAREAARDLGGAGKVESRLVESFLASRLARPVRTREAFESLLREESPRLYNLAADRADAVDEVLEAYAETRARLVSLMRSRSDPAAGTFLEGLHARARSLLPPSFPELYGNKRLMDVSRYLAALRVRAERGLARPAADAAREARVAPFEKALNEEARALSPRASAGKRQALEEFYWMIQEFRVSLFAQEMKTAYPVSEKRLQRKLEEIRRMV